MIRWLLLLLPVGVLGQTPAAPATSATPSQPVAPYNFVPNGGFETKGDCPNDHFQIGLATGWRTPNKGTPDYYHTCGVNGMHVPDNRVGYQKAHGGEAYAGLFLFSSLREQYREYLAIKLATALDANHYYRLTLYMSRADWAGFATRGLEAALLTDLPQADQQPKLTDIPYTPVMAPGPLMDEKRWVRVTAELRAKGGEQWLVLGLFAPDNQVQYYQTPQYVTGAPAKGQILEVGVSCYYYIDDVSLVASERAPELETLPFQTADLDTRLTPGVRYALPDVQFDLDRTELKTQALPVLEELSYQLEEHPDWHVQLLGHTDSLGTEAYNQQLSLARANAVGAWLLKQGIAPGRVTVRGFGTAMPLAPNTTAEGRARNRRVELLILRNPVGVRQP